LRRFASEKRQRDGDLGEARARRRGPQSVVSGQVRSVAGVGRECDVDVFKNAAWGDAEHAVGGFHEIVALGTGVVAAQIVGEREIGGELFGFDEEARAICDPGARWSHTVLLIKLRLAAVMR